MLTNPTYLTVVAILVFFVYIAIEDENFLPFVNLKFKILVMEIRKQWLLLRMKPDIWLMKWRMQRVLKKLQADKELQALVKEHQEVENARTSDSDLS